MAEKFVLRVTAGPSYDPSTHQLVNVNSPTSMDISNAHMDSKINVRIKNYRGLPKGSPSSSPYFSTPAHTSDLYSISFSFRPKSSINGNDLLFGNDFDHPIRDRLPPGFNTAFRIVKWAIDPGLDGDVMADEPYLYGPALSSLNAFRVEGKESTALPEMESEEAPLEEGGDEDGLQLREDQGIPADAAARKKHFLVEKNREDFEFSEGRVYQADFFNPYLDFNEFSLKLPGFTLPVIKYWDGQPLRTHSLRYVLRNRQTKDLYFVIVFTLLPKESVESNDESDSEESDENEDAFEDTVETFDDDID
ncbi:DUF1769-domain-containing protein [Xylona heveae TC161]|uniref:DUF1769-domain-containing protein n=1 Tax=Xylona heveae (strain CBS 132557 / TC161) TaxID=1328760 RepID=A0A165JHW6_XYLHT|nr:DUF1769-domain-containing protein [Xylona heveae TC161]KZF26259.1 DUF1769-domain-containing protein [Xylona heveae TC161]